MRNEACEYWNQGFNFCRLAGGDCGCGGEQHYCDYPQQLSQERKANADDLKADADREEGVIR